MHDSARALQLCLAHVVTAPIMLTKVVHLSLALTWTAVIYYDFFILKYPHGPADKLANLAWRFRFLTVWNMVEITTFVPRIDVSLNSFLVLCVGSAVCLLLLVFCLWSVHVRVWQCGWCCEEREVLGVSSSRHVVYCRGVPYWGGTCRVCDIQTCRLTRIPYKQTSQTDRLTDIETGRLITTNIVCTAWPWK